MPPFSSVKPEFYEHSSGKVATFKLGAWGGKKKPTAAIVFVHGMNAHVGLYWDLLCRLSAKEPSWAIFAFDQPGHGQTFGEPGLIWDFNKHLNVVIDEVNMAREALPEGTPVFVYGDSFGGLLSAHIGTRLGSELAGAVLMAPALGVEYTLSLRIMSFLGDVAAALVPRAKIVAAVREEDFTDEAEVQEWRRSIPGLLEGPLPVITAKSGESGMREIRRRAREFSIPVLVLHGTTDRCTSPQASRAWLEKEISTDGSKKRFVPFEGGLHMLFEGRNRERVEAEVVAFVRKCVQGQPL